MHNKSFEKKAKSLHRNKDTVPKKNDFIEKKKKKQQIFIRDVITSQEKVIFFKCCRGCCWCRYYCPIWVIHACISASCVCFYCIARVCCRVPLPSSNNVLFKPTITFNRCCCFYWQRFIYFILLLLLFFALASNVQQYNEKKRSWHIGNTISSRLSLWTFFGCCTQFHNVQICSIAICYHLSSEDVSRHPFLPVLYAVCIQEVCNRSLCFVTLSQFCQF